jgi:hypothetical protein
MVTMDDRRDVNDSRRLRQPHVDLGHEGVWPRSHEVARTKGLRVLMERMRIGIQNRRGVARSADWTRQIKRLQDEPALGTTKHVRTLGNPAE